MILTAHQLRQKYLNFFEKRGHVIVPSSLLVPDNDPTTLFTTAGMQPMMPYLLGAKHPQGNRIVDSQKCFRAQDLEEVGDNRHTTFFEMLGNWSLGDYFKQAQLTWFFKFLTDEVGLDPHRLYVTVFAGSEKYEIEADQEAISIWQQLFADSGIDAPVIANPETAGLANGRIFLYPAKKNWWSRTGGPDKMPVGELGGPDSEIFYDFGPELGLHEGSPFAHQQCHVNCDCGRFLEIGNSVFMQYQRTETGFKELPQKNIDFGGGLERILAASQQQIDIFKTELFVPLIDQISAITSLNYDGQHQSNFRIIADHAKAAVMLIADGVNPANKDQGYMVRRLIRRAIRYGKLMGANQELVPSLVKPVINIYADHYTDLPAKETKIAEIIAQESEKFEHTIDRGLREFKQVVSRQTTLTGDTAFQLYQTYGFPLEMSMEEAQRHQLQIDDNILSDFNQAKQAHSIHSRTGAEQKFKGGLADHSAVTTAYHTATHLIHAALRQVLGTAVQQKGSNINDQRLRFDFTHPRAVTPEEIKQISQLVNSWIKQDLPVVKLSMTKDKALAFGALAFFAERYPDEVAVYVIGKTEDSFISKELCGGPHVNSTAKIGQIEIFKEKSAAAGVRRVYARKIIQNKDN